MKNPSSILITGASSGIGEALAREYARSGAFLALSGRYRARLDDVAEACRGLGAEVMARRADVTDRDAMADFIREADARRPLDLVIANAGISGGSGGMGETEEQTRAIFDVNVTGVLNTVWPAVEPMRERGRGQIAVVSSIAGMNALPGAPAYSASKAAVKAYAEALNGWLRRDGVTVTAICPGFVKSRITDKNDFPMPLFMDAPRAARIIRRGLERGGVSVVFPRRLAFAAWLIGLLPPGLRVALLSRLPKKG
ncbi:MAG: SDR family NAD(P)-dependent oxidoreductase [Alphaproteobacteria bacterium]|nr:SDR family NAD(P)-dependent oxidoreductase [Alphaproteobacteria bacterium]